MAKLLRKFLVTIVTLPFMAWEKLMSKLLTLMVYCVKKRLHKRDMGKGYVMYIGPNMRFKGSVAKVIEYRDDASQCLLEFIEYEESLTKVKFWSKEENVKTISFDEYWTNSILNQALMEIREKAALL